VKALVLFSVFAVVFATAAAPAEPTAFDRDATSLTIEHVNALRGVPYWEVEIPLDDALMSAFFAYRRGEKIEARSKLAAYDALLAKFFEAGQISPPAARRITVLSVLVMRDMRE
jgi:hypothetical protein